MATTSSSCCLPESAAHLQRSADGIWFAGMRDAVSYHPDGNAACFELEERSFWFQHRNACIAAVVQRFAPAGTIYDIGGGNGCVARALIDAGYPTALIEPGEVGARNAAQRGISVVICATLAAAGLPADSLPAAGLFDVLEHIADDAAFLAELQRCLIPGGRLYLTVPAYSWLWSDDDVAAGHSRRHTLDGVKARLRAAGFRSLYSTYFFAPLPLPIFALRTLPSLFGRRRLSRQAYGALHRPRGASFAESVWAWETRRIAQGRTIPFGSSCLIVAEKLR